MKSFIKKNLLLLLVLALVTATFLHFGRAKAGFFIDEIHTYGLSNSHYAPYISDAVGGSLKDTVITRDELIDYATVNDGEIFDFASVYSNQIEDVHPPLYYFLFNAASSLVGENFSKWTGLVLDYIIFICSLLLLYRLALELYDGASASALCVTALYGLSTMGISTAVYIRMYVLLVFFTVLLAFFALRLLRTEKSRYCLYIGAVVFLGMMTQYYFVFYAFFLCASLCVYLLIKKKYSLLWKLAVCAAAGVGLMILAFPASIKHIFVGNGKVVGGVSVTEAVSNTSLYGERLNSFMHFVTYGLKASIVCAAVAVIVYRKFKFDGELFLLVLPALLSWAVIAIVSPVYEERYIYNLGPIFVLLAGFFIKDDLRALPVVAVVSIACLFISKPNNLFSSYAKFDSELRPYSSAACVYLQNDKFEGLTYDFNELLMFDEVYATDSTEKAAKYLDNADDAVVFVDEDKFWSSGLNPDKVIPEILQKSDYTDYEQIYTNGFSGVYHLTKGAA